MDNMFREVFTVGELKGFLEKISDDTVILQTNPLGGCYRKKILVLNLEKSRQTVLQLAVDKKVETISVLRRT